MCRIRANLSPVDETKRGKYLYSIYFLKTMVGQSAERRVLALSRVMLLAKVCIWIKCPRLVRTSDEISPDRGWPMSVRQRSW
jgi:hypothetical protein